MIIHGGTMYLDADRAPTTGKALLVKDGRIVSISDLDSLRSQSPDAKLIDATGKTVLPGLVDAHAHIDGLGIARHTLDLVGTTSLDEVLDLISERAAHASDGEWIEGRGWDQNDWKVKEYPTAAAADLRVKDNPLWVSRIDGHAALANSVAMKLAGVDASTPDPEGGRILRDASGEPTGVFIDNATELVTRHIPLPSRAARKRRLIDALEYIASQGLTGVHEAGVATSSNPPELIEIYKELADEGNMPVRVYFMIPDDETLIQEWFEDGPLVDYKNRLTVRSVKLYADGALGSRGAALLKPYSDDPENSGLMLITEARIAEVARRAVEAGFQVGVHAIGDRGVRTALNAFESAGVSRENRFRIEHFQVASLEDFDRAAQLGVIASMQPTHATSDMPWAEQRVGHDRIQGSYAWRRILDAGGRLALGSDFPVEHVNPFFGIHSAVTRQDHDGNPDGGWTPDQLLTFGEALRGFTLDAAHAAFEESQRGSIEEGKMADFTIVEGDLSMDDPADLWKTEVFMTIVNGRIAWSRGGR